MAGGGSTPGENMEDIFKSHVYTGNGSSSNTITTGIDLSTDDGIVWVKARETTDDHSIFDPILNASAGTNKTILQSNRTATTSRSDYIKSVSTTGFVVGASGTTNQSGKDYISWSFKNTDKFFKLINYTGNGTTTNVITHNLGHTPGCIMIKKAPSTGDAWIVWHRGIHPTTNADTSLRLDSQSGDTSTGTWITDVTATSFTLKQDFSRFNQNNATYSAFVFAHHDGDGTFGPDGNADVISCGSYNGSISAEVTLNFEPQWLLVKRTSGADPWHIWDTKRGWIAEKGFDQGGLNATLNADDGTPESNVNYIALRNNGFKVTSSASSVSSGNNIVYIAIAKAPLAVPTSASDVFNVVQKSGSDPSYTAGFEVDMAVNKSTGGSNTRWYHRSRGDKKLFIDTTSAEQDSGGEAWDFNDGANLVNSTSYYAYLWRRAPKFMDEVFYEGNGTSGRTVDHRLGVVPEMMWIKNREQSTGTIVYHSGIGNTNALFMHSNVDLGAAQTSYWNNTSPTASNFTVGNSSATNNSGRMYIANLFCSLDGISKVGSYTGNGSASQDIDCGFSNGSAFIFIKDTLSNTEWFAFGHDGINSGNDPYFQWDQSFAEGSRDSVDPLSSGFTVTNDVNTTLNVSGKEYIFYAVAA